MSVTGHALFKEDPFIASNIRAMVYDSDAVSAYPSATEVANVSKATTKKELIRIADIPEEKFRLQNLNAILGETNALEYCQQMFNMPSPQSMLSMFD